MPGLPSVDSLGLSEVCFLSCVALSHASQARCFAVSCMNALLTAASLKVTVPCRTKSFIAAILALWLVLLWIFRASATAVAMILAPSAYFSLSKSFSTST